MNRDRRVAVREEYRDASHLDARIRLHTLFSTNKEPFHRWVFDHLDLSEQCSVLEIGAGSGRLWVENSHRIPPGWRVMLADLSPGMLAEARRNLAGCPHPFYYVALDAQALPFPDASFDAIIANHMLYHVPDRPVAYGEFCRVLRLTGTLYASTNGRHTMREYDELVMRVRRPERGERKVSLNADALEESGFNLEHGAVELSRAFPSVRLHRREDPLVVTDAGPLVDYAEASEDLSAEELDALRELLESIIASEGSIRITKDVGMFEARQDRPRPS